MKRMEANVATNRLRPHEIISSKFGNFDNNNNCDHHREKAATFPRALKNLEVSSKMTSSSPSLISLDQDDDDLPPDLQDENDANNCDDSGEQSSPLDIDGDDVGEDISSLFEQRWQDFAYPNHELFVIGSSSDGDGTTISSGCCASSWSTCSDHDMLNISSGVESLSPYKCKKQVRFADAAGKPLVAICSFGDTPCEMTPPEASAISNLLNLLQKSALLNHRYSIFPETAPAFEPQFPDPLSNYAELTEKVRKQNVALESVNCRDGRFVKGMIRARRTAAPDKTVFVRATFDSWASSNDWVADIFPLGNYEGDIGGEDDEYGPPVDYDLYEFSLPTPPYSSPDTVISFAICYQCSGGNQPGEYWDNNGGKNYSFQYRPPMLPNSSKSQTVSKSKTIFNGHQHNYNSSPVARTAAELDAYRAQWIRSIVCMDDTDSGMAGSADGERAITCS